MLCPYCADGDTEVSIQTAGNGAQFASCDGGHTFVLGT